MWSKLWNAIELAAIGALLLAVGLVILLGTVLCRMCGVKYDYTPLLDSHEN